MYRFCLPVVFVLALNVPSQAQFRIAVDINQMTPAEGRTVMRASGRLRCEGIFGPVSRLCPERPDPRIDHLSPGELSGFVSKTGAYRIVSEDGLGFSEAPALEWNRWKSILGREPSQGMVFSEQGGLAFPINGQWTLSGIPGYVIFPGVPWPYWPDYHSSFPYVWDTCLDRSLIGNYTRATGAKRVLLNCRDFNDRPAYNANFFPVPYRSHLLDSLAHPDVVGAVFEIETSVEYLNARIPQGLGNHRNIAEGIKAVLGRGKDCYLLLSPGAPNGRTYADRVRAVVTELARQGVPFGDGRLWVVVACYKRETSNTGFLTEGWGANSVEAALEWLRAYRK